jgi:type I restriction enzyme S subunit
MTNKNVPKLRFPEFLESWTTQKIENIAKINDGTHTTPNYVDSGIKFISVENIEDFSKSNKFIEKEAYQKYKVKSKKNDIFLTRIGTLGESNILTEDETYAYYVSLALIRCNNEINPFYLNQYIKSEFFQRELWNKTLHNAVPKKINLNDLEQCLISFPRLLDEQNKIACFLFDIDKKIGLLKDKKEGFIEFKHYLLQNLFPQNGSCVPKLRFNKNVTYEKCQVSDFLRVSELDAVDDINRRLTVKLNLKGIYKREVKPNEKEGATKQYERKAGQFIYGKQNLFKGAFGIIPFELDGFLSSKDLPSFDFNNNIIPQWFYYYFSREDFYKHLENLSNGTGSKRISPEEFLKILINVPQDKEEQEKIASTLSTIDNKIDLIEKEIELVEEYKKGLLQKMFI